MSNGLHLMNKISSLHTSLGTEYSYNFLHTTLQEYMAAVYVSQRSELIKTVMHKEVIVTFIFGISSQMETVDNTALSNNYDYRWRLRLLYEYPQFDHLNPYHSQLSRIDRIYYRLPYDYYIAGYLIAHYKINIDCISFTSNTHRDISLFTNGLNSECHSGTVAVGIGKIHELFVMCDNHGPVILLISCNLQMLYKFYSNLMPTKKNIKLFALSWRSIQYFQQSFKRGSQL